MMRGKIFLLGLFFFSAFVPRSWADDCTGFVSDFKENKLASSQTYRFESKELYLPSGYCPFSPLSLVSNQDQRAEFFLVEQCRAIGYKMLKTTMVCVQDAKTAKVRSICDVDGVVLAPCLKKELAAILKQRELS